MATSEPAALPIDPLLPEVLRQLQSHRCLVVEAAPGAGKTTRLPRALYEASPQHEQQVIVTEPRRLAARLAARFVARELNTELGQLVGYSVRYEEKSSPRTRIRYMTEGVLLRQLLSQPQLSKARVVVLDEFHERHLASDQLLVLLKRLTQERDDFRLVVMSATLDAEPIAKFLDDCPRLRSEGRTFPLTIQHAEQVDDRPLEKRVTSAVKQALAQQASGHVLVFLPGVRDIERARALLEPQLPTCEVLPLHGELPLAGQAKAVEPGRQRKVVLATNVAESSITIDGVTAVVDSGLARVAAHSPWTGRTTLDTREVSQSSAVQRAGRAGRTAPGFVYRLYSEGNFKARPAQDVPELQRMDLTELVLSLRGMGCADPSALDWLDAPPQAALDSASALLQSLGAVVNDELTPIGRRLLQLPLPPRLARVIVEGEHLGITQEACLAAALLSERDIRSRHQRDQDLETGASDLQERIDRFRDAEYSEFDRHSVRALGLEMSRLQQVRKAYKQLLRMTRDRAQADSARPPASSEELEQRLQRCLLAGFNDRVARRQNPQSHNLTLTNGTRATLSEHSVARHIQLMVALDTEERSVQGRRSGAVVSLVSAVEADWLLDAYPNQVSANDELVFNPDKQRVEELSRLSYGSVTLEESRQPASAGPETAKVLWEASKSKLTAIFGKRSGVEALQIRIQLLQEHMPELQWPAATLTLEELLRSACEHATSLQELSEFDFEALLLGELSYEQQQALLQQAPEHVQLPSGRRLKVHYTTGKPPWVESRLQDFFGMADGPSICGGRLKLTLHLLAPNQRAVQVTSDLSGFWERHYAEVRKELRRRYAKHFWPEDGRSASPPPPRGHHRKSS